MSMLGTRPRRAAVALFALGGSLLGIAGAVAPAEAACPKASIWIYHSRQGEAGREYIWNKRCVIPDQGWSEDGHWGPFTAENDMLPEGWRSGVGVEVWMASPV
jgi:hypothetical protein